MQHSTSSPLAPIPARVVPSPWEDLASYITRVATEMGYRNPGWILHPEGVVSSVQPYNLCKLRCKADYQFLEQLLYLNERTLYDLTLHRFTVCFLEPVGSRQSIPDEIPRPLLTQYMFQTFFHPYSATKVCSVCLTEEPAHGRLYWSALPVVACLRHRVFLTDRCPMCQSPIPLLRPSLSNCPRCHKGDYREASIVHVPEDPFFSVGQDLILRNLGVQCTIQNTEVTDMSRTPLLQLLPWQYFLLLDAFRCILGPLFPDAPFLQVSADTRVLLRCRPRPQSTLSLLDWSVIISTVHSLCTSWPDNFLSFLDALPHARSERRRKRDRQRATGLQRDFGVFYEKWLYKRLAHPAFAFLHEAFETYLTRYIGGEVTRRLLPFRRRPGEHLQERPYLTKVQARKLLGIGEDVLQTLIREGVLRTMKKPIGVQKKRNMFLIDRGSVEVLRREWEDLIPLNLVARSYLGVTKSVVLALEDAGMLIPTQGPGTDGYKPRFYTRTEVQQFEKNLLLHSVKTPERPSESVSLPVVSTIVGLTLVTLVKEVLDNNLTPREENSGRPLFQRLSLSRPEVPSFLEEYKQRQRMKLGLLTAGEVAENLGISKRVLRRWVRKDLMRGEKIVIGGKKASLFFQRKALDDFHENYAFSQEVAAMLGIAPQTVSKYVRKGIVSPVTGRRTTEGGTRLLFLREEIASLVSSAQQTKAIAQR
jgi:hypothetical protein